MAEKKSPLVDCSRSRSPLYSHFPKSKAAKQSGGHLSTYICIFSAGFDRSTSIGNMVGPSRPQFVLFGSSIVQFSYSNHGWGAILADFYARKVFFFFFI